MLIFSSQVRRLSAALLALVLLPAAWAASLGPGDKIPELDTGRAVYRDVVIRSVNARTVTFVHSGGLASLPLRGLPLEWRQKFGYDPAAEAQAERKYEQDRERAESLLRAEAKHAQAERNTALRQRYEQLLLFKPGEVVAKELVDMRPRFNELSLGVKNQGLRPSCAVFAVVGALEYLNAEIAGKPERLSEEYLIWATLSLVQRPSPIEGALVPSEDVAEPARIDTGFSLEEVATALRSYGIPTAASMPNTFGKGIREIPTPGPALVEEARTRRQVYVYRVPGRDSAAVLPRVVQALNLGIPVPIGLQWPHYATLRHGYLSEQQPIPGYAHAVTLVGYRCTTGRLQDCVFIFRNSYGNRWGQAGYGTATYGYLQRCLRNAILLEVQDRADTAPGSVFSPAQ